MHSNLLFVVKTLIICSLFVYINGQNVTDKCAKDWNRARAKFFDEDADWARRMFDANGKRESGMLDGNYFYEGDYLECIHIHENVSDPEAIKGQFCVTYGFNWLPTWWTKKGMGFCIPSSCSDQDAKILYETVSVNIVKLNENTTTTYCIRDRELSQDPGAIVAITIVCIFLALVGVATFYDIYCIPKPSAIDINTDNANYSKQIPNGKANIKEISTVPNAQILFKGNGRTKNGTVEEHVYVEMNGIASATNNAYVHSRSDVVKIHPDEKASNYVESQKHQEKHQENKAAVADTCDYKPSVPERLLLSFSLKYNIPRLFRAKAHPSSVLCLNGMRFISMLAVVWGHNYSTGLFGAAAPTISNRYPSLEMMYVLPIEFIHQMWLVVDTFFLMSGYLVASAFLKALEKRKKVSVRMMVMYYFHRYWRLTPVYMIVLMMYVNFFHYMGNGPFMPSEHSDITNCKQIWWRNLLYIQNLWPNDNYTDCFGWAWYLAIDMQLYIMAPAFIIPIFFFPKVGIVLMILGYIGSLVANLVLYTQYVTGSVERNHFIDIYVKPWTRATVYFIGMLLAYFIYRTKGKVKLNKLSVIIGWVLAFTIFLTCTYLPYLTDCEASICRPVTETGYIVWMSVISTMYSMFLSWVIFACINGYAGFINSFLSWSFWIPLSRLCYTAYLVHFPIIMFWYFSTPKQFYLTQFIMQYYFCGHIIFTILIAVVVSLVFEVPMLGIEKVLLPRT